MNKKDFNKLLLTELRLIEGLSSTKSQKIADLESALVDNENLKALGYELTNQGLAKLSLDYSRDPNMTPLYKRVMRMEPEIKVSPMYPDFPTQVLEMDEFDYRVHQSIHYLTTYGVESILGVDVKEGWLPKFEEEVDRVKDERISELKALDYLSPAEVDSNVISRLIEKKERLEEKELIISKVVAMRTDLEIDNIPFKENIASLYGDIILNGSLDERYKTFDKLAEVSRHPGDILDVLEYIVVKNRYKHLKTSVKRGFVELIESFEPYQVEENLANNKWSRAFLGKNRQARSVNRNIALIDYLSFNRFSKKDSIKAIVEKMKDGELLSWNQNLERLYEAKDYDAVREMLVERPGIYFRQVNRLIGLGVPYIEVSNDIKSVAEELKTQSIISALNNFKVEREVNKDHFAIQEHFETETILSKLESRDRKKVVQVFFDALVANLESQDIDEIKGKKVYIDEGIFDLSKSKIEITDKFVEGGYITNGMALRIPEKAKYLRFFTYWNDENRIDIDLHGITLNKNGESSHVGWNGRYKDASLVHSGDITHSDASEYIDVNLKSAKKSGVESIQLNINSYTTVPFSEIDEVFTGLMVLGKMGKEVDLFDPKNVVFRHDLDYNEMSINYGYIDLVDNVIYVGGEARDYHNDRELVKREKANLTVASYLNILLATQNSTIVSNKEDSDITIRVDKDNEGNSYSLIDENYFLD